MKQKRADLLLERYRQGLCSDAERRQVEAWYLRASDEMIGTDLREPDYSKIDRVLRERLPLMKQKQAPRTLWIPYAAAVLLIALGIGYWIAGGPKLSVDQLAATEILAGGNRATLTLADGRTIDLNETQKGIVIEEERITYTDGSSVNVLSDHAAQLILTTPKGGTYQVTLPDGSAVWLNANSTLRYPSKFSDKERVVELTGEAYFDVVSIRSRNTKERLPFRVKTNDQTVEVLGTEFNIAAYADELDTKTTLVEGAVRLQAKATGASMSLVPGEQGTLVNGRLRKQPVDIATYTAWRKGDFQFAENLESVMKKVGRWYDVEVAFQDELLKREYVSGSVRRSRPLSDVLELLTDVTGAQFSVVVTENERRVVVMQ